MLCNNFIMTSFTNATVDECDHIREIERFRGKEALTEHKDQLTTLFVNGCCNTNREFYAPLEEVAKFAMSIHFSLGSRG